MSIDITRAAVADVIRRSREPISENMLYALRNALDDCGEKVTKLSDELYKARQEIARLKGAKQ
jgi:hypothetical protein